MAWYETAMEDMDPEGWVGGRVYTWPGADPDFDWPLPPPKGIAPEDEVGWTTDPLAVLSPEDDWIETKVPEIERTTHVWRGIGRTESGSGESGEWVSGYGDQGLCLWYNLLPWTSGEYAGIWAMSSGLDQPSVYVDAAKASGFWHGPSRHRCWKAGDEWLWNTDGGWALSSGLGLAVREAWNDRPPPSVVTVTPAAASGTHVHAVSSRDDLEEVRIMDELRATLDGYSFSGSDPENEAGAGDWTISWTALSGEFCPGYQAFDILLYDHVYEGDAWWSCGSLEGTYLPRGSKRGTSEGEYDMTQARTVHWEFDGWLPYSGIERIATFSGSGDETLEHPTFFDPEPGEYLWTTRRWLSGAETIASSSGSPRVFGHVSGSGSGATYHMGSGEYENRLVVAAGLWLAMDEWQQGHRGMFDG